MQGGSRVIFRQKIQPAPITINVGGGGGGGGGDHNIYLSPGAD